MVDAGEALPQKCSFVWQQGFCQVCPSVDGEAGRGLGIDLHSYKFLHEDEAEKVQLHCRTLNEVMKLQGSQHRGVGVLLLQLVGLLLKRIMWALVGLCCCSGLPTKVREEAITSIAVIAGVMEKVG